jgi:RNA polymerase sigma factor (sigma-70 family)
MTRADRDANSAGKAAGGPNGLLARARDGEGAAIAELVERLRPRLASLAAYYASCCAEEAGDLEQEAWVAVLEALPQIRLSLGDPREYLIKRARWRVLNFINEQAIRRADESLEEHDRPTPARAPDQAAARHLLDQIFERLTDRQAVVLRALLAGHTSADISRLLDCSTANIAWHVGKIREMYRELTRTVL